MLTTRPKCRPCSAGGGRNRVGDCGWRLRRRAYLRSGCSTTTASATGGRRPTPRLGGAKLRQRRRWRPELARPPHQLIAERGRIGWQQATGYGKRNQAETAMSRYKHLIGPKLRPEPACATGRGCHSGVEQDNPNSKARFCLGCVTNGQGRVSSTLKPVPAPTPCVWPLSVPSRPE